MSRLILDHYRRWWWVLAIAGAFQFRFGWSIARRSEVTFEFWVFMVALWTSAILLSFNLKHGVVRTVMALPLTARQIGRSWWVATIPIPAVALTALLFMGAGTFHYFHPDKAFPAGRLALASLFVLPWLGTAFTCLYGINNETIFGNWRERVSATFFSLLAMAMLFGGMLTLQDSTKQPVKFSIYLGVGALLIVVGWFRAERFVMGRASFSLPALRRKNPSGQHKAPAGFGGLPFLWQNIFIPLAYFGLAFVGLLLVVVALRQGDSKLVSKQLFETLLPIFNTSGYVFCFMFLLQQTGMQLRLLRTLPISTTALAATLVLLPATSILVVGLVWSVVGGGIASGNAFLTLSNCLMYATLMAIGAAVFVWQGVKLATCLVLVVFVLVSNVGPRIFHPTVILTVITALISLGLIVLAFELTRRLLNSSSRPYRNSSAMMTDLGGWGGRR